MKERQPRVWNAAERTLPDVLEIDMRMISLADRDMSCGMRCCNAALPAYKWKTFAHTVKEYRRCGFGFARRGGPRRHSDVCLGASRFCRRRDSRWWHLHADRIARNGRLSAGRERSQAPTGFSGFPGGGVWYAVGQAFGEHCKK